MATSKNELPLLCDRCMRTFPSSFVLKRHVQRYHSEIFLSCYHCCFKTKYKGNLIKHVKKHLDGTSRHWKEAQQVYTCMLCESFRSSNRNEVVNHYATSHNVILNPVELEFDDWEQFLAWKCQLETQDLIKFTKTRGAKKTDNTITCRFYCFRNGFYRKQGTGRRRMKLLGSNRLNSVCPSLIKAVQDRKTGRVRVTYISSHVGHVAEPSRMSLNKKEKEELASKIAMKVPFDRILDDIKDEAVSCNQISRVHLTTRKDLWNIERSARKRASQVFNSKSDAAGDDSEWVVQRGVPADDASRSDNHDDLAEGKRQLQNYFSEILDQISSSSGVVIIRNLLEPAVSLLKSDSNSKSE